MKKKEKIKAAAQLVEQLEEVEKALKAIGKGKRANAIMVPTSDTLCSKDDKVEIPFFARRVIAEHIEDGLVALHKHLSTQIEETSI